MPATAARFEYLQERTGSWGALLEKAQPKTVDPLAEWMAEFSAWRNEVLRLRSFEADVFLREARSPVAERMHRGFLCHLISEGERLALVLLEERLGSPAKEGKMEKQSGFLDEFILNLRTTLETWHLLEPRAENEANPLAAFR